MINYISPSLINSWLYMLNSPYGNIDDFLSTLRKEPFEPSIYMQKGIDFENDVLAGKYPEYTPYIKGALYQVRIWGVCNGIGISGVIDFLQPDVIIDTKWAKSYEVGKYFNSSQHIFYPYVTKVYKFKYMINPECYIEEYNYKKGSAEKLIEDFIEWLKVAGYYEEWKERWVK